jgi:fumarate hydratase class I
MTVIIWGKPTKLSSAINICLIPWWGWKEEASTLSCGDKFYLGSIGGPAAILAKNCIHKVEVLDNEDDGMEAVWKIDVENFPAFIVVDDKGDDFFQE